MPCGGCGKTVRKHNPRDKRGNSLKKYAYLKPHQIALRDAQEKEDK